MHLNHDQVRYAKALGWNPERTYSVSITDVWISRDAQISIGNQIKALCISYDLPYSVLRDSLVQQLYWHEDAARLGMMIEVRDSNVESLYLEIPEKHWGFRQSDEETQ